MYGSIICPRCSELMDQLICKACGFVLIRSKSNDAQYALGFKRAGIPFPHWNWFMERVEKAKLEYLVLSYCYKDNPANLSPNVFSLESSFVDILMQLGIDEVDIPVFCAYLNLFEELLSEVKRFFKVKEERVND